jgi:hypothetical protein
MFGMLSNTDHLRAALKKEGDMLKDLVLAIEVEDADAETVACYLQRIEDDLKHIRRTVLDGRAA